MQLGVKSLRVDREGTRWPQARGFLTWSVLSYTFIYNFIPRELALFHIQAQSRGLPHRVKAGWRAGG